MSRALRLTPINPFISLIGQHPKRIAAEKAPPLALRSPML
jgi:hypothetical protein